VTNLKNRRTWLIAARDVTLRVIGFAIGFAIFDHFFKH
jgi:hypothetical protein